MKPYDPNTDYCGPGKGFWAWVIPDKPWGVNINPCCYMHDWAYEKGGTEEDRARADKAFRVCIYNRFVKKRPRFLAWLVAWRHYIAVKRLGWTRFNYHPEQTQA